MRSALLSICFLSFCKGDLVEILGNDQEAVMQNTNFYKILGVDPKADLQEIKKAFRNLALTKHPDRFANLDGSAKEAVKKVYSTISEAYETLRDAKKRASYDARLPIIDVQNLVHALRDSSSLPTPVKSFVKQVGHTLDKISEFKAQESDLKAQIRDILIKHDDWNWNWTWERLTRDQEILRQYLERMILHSYIGLVPREIRESLVEKVQVIFEKLDIKEKFVHPELRNFFEQITWLIAGQSAAKEMGVALLEPEVPRETDVQIMSSAGYWSQLAFAAALSLAALHLENVLPGIGGQV